MFLKKRYCVRQNFLTVEFASLLSQMQQKKTNQATPSSNSSRSKTNLGKVTFFLLFPST